MFPHSGSEEGIQSKSLVKNTNENFLDLLYLLTELHDNYKGAVFESMFQTLREI